MEYTESVVTMLLVGAKVMLLLLMHLGDCAEDLISKFISNVLDKTIGKSKANSRSG